MLECLFSMEEVPFALIDFSSDKAPSLDWFSISFWQCSWEVMDFLFGNSLSRAGF